jgi:short-subunit dehydrogenase
VHTVKPGFVETEGFPQARLPSPARRIVIGPERVARHVLASLEHGRGETTVPRVYAPVGALQSLLPDAFARALARGANRPRIGGRT